MKHLRYLIPVIVIGLVGFFWGCGPQTETSSIPASTGTVVTSIELWGLTGGTPMTGDSKYGVVRRDWVDTFYKEFRRDLFSRDVVKWDERFDCNHFASYFVSLAQIRYYADNWGKPSKAETLAIGERWYIPGGSGTKGHAIVVLITESGMEHLEPQTGQFITLTPAELASTYFLRF